MERNRAYSLGLYEKAFPGGLGFPKMLEETRRLGFDRLEISIDETDGRLSRLHWSAGERQALVSAIRDTGTPIRTMCLSGHRKYPMGSMDSNVRERAMDIMKRAVDFSAEVGVSVIQLAGYDVYYEEGSESTRAYFEENLRRAAAFGAEAGVVLAFETMETPFMDTVGKAMDYVDRVGSPWLGVYPDIGNLQNAAVLYGHDVVEDLKTGAGHIFAIHLKETLPGVYRDMRFGSGGHTRYEDCLAVAAGMGVRMFTGEFWHQNGQDYTIEIPHAAAFLRERLDRAYKEV